MTTSCAGCGIKENNDEGIKLKICTACKSVRYCSVKCQKEHRSKHKKACKKRAAELRDELLFKQPESSHLGDCPICFLPLPLEMEGYEMLCCCCKYLCAGCSYAILSTSKMCPFCRKSTNLSGEQEVRTNYERREKANDPIAIYGLGKLCYKNDDFRGAFEFFSRSAKLGCAEAAFDLALMYRDGHGVEKDEKKMERNMEDAAIAGHPRARLALADFELGRDRLERSITHLIIGSNLGDIKSAEMLQKYYEYGLISKEDLDSAISGHKAAIAEMKSNAREDAEVTRKLFERRGDE